MHERLRHWVEHLAHVLPAQAPIRDFVHHNTLHGFQHLPFAAAMAAANALTGAATYWSEARFREAFANGRITRDDLQAALLDAGVGDLERPVYRALSRADVLLASLLAGNEVPGVRRLIWLCEERGLEGDPAFARCRELVASQLVQAESAAWREDAQRRWQQLCARVGRDWSWRSLLEHLSGEDVLERVRAILQRHLAAHLDLGVAAWRNPQQAEGFFAAWKASAGLDMQWELDELPNVRDEIVHLLGEPLDVLREELPRLLCDETLWYAYLERLSLELPGWSGMFLWRDRHPEGGDGAPVAMGDYLAVRVLLERMLCEDLICRLTGSAMSFGELVAWYAGRPGEFFVRDALRRDALPEDLYNEASALLLGASAVDVAVWEELATRIAARRDDGLAARAWQLQGLCQVLALSGADLEALTPADAAALLDAASGLGEAERGQVWLLAYERHYREQLFSALGANHPRRRTVAHASAQVVMCMDDREEGTRRHLEEVAPDIVTYGAAGFFGVAMYWQGLDDAERTALCPVVVQPRHLVREEPAAGVESAFSRHARRRERRLRWREALYQSTRRQPLAGTVVAGLSGLPALAALTAVSLAPGWFAETLARWHRQHEGAVPTALALTTPGDAPDVPSPAQPQSGFKDAEQIEHVAAFLRTIGLTEGFAPLVLILGHGSGSQNNPHRSAYDCGACSGRHGGPNARVFAAMANRPEVRRGLRDLGIDVPDSCRFVAAEHNTCDDAVEWYDLDAVPPAWQEAMNRLVGQLAEACRAHAAERCRRLASAPPGLPPWRALQHVRGRAGDLSQARPELGHATNAAAFIGRREMSRGLFLDRRVFLISYDPSCDADGAIVESILLAAGPVGAGIALEYYFSSVDNERFGCGSKVTHNLTGQFGVMEGADSDLRTGLPWQMVEIHEPMRLLVVVEQTPAVLSAIVARQPALQELIGNEWIVVAAKDPESPAIHRFCPRRGWLPWSGRTVLPQVAASRDWFAGEREALAPALLLGGAR